MAEKPSTKKSEIQIVWFKKDLRITDHMPIYKASKNPMPTLMLYIVETDYWSKPFANRRHWCFIHDSLEDLALDLATHKQQLVIKIGSAIQVFKDLHLKYEIVQIFAHEECGNRWTYDRDIEVRKWFLKNHIDFKEFPSNGVVRGLKDRNEWSKIRNSRMQEQLIPTPNNITAFKAEIGSPIPSKKDNIFLNNFSGIVQKGGRRQALKIINSFLKIRGKNYLYNISKPGKSEYTCSRISPHLTWGTISTKELINMTKDKAKNLDENESKIWKKNISALNSRLTWRCHFIQKLESQPSIEFQCMHSYYEKLRDKQLNSNFYSPWKNGLTGYPFVDACMRSLNYNGWINFRMRAMLVSFASYDLWLDWRKIGYHLAQMFTDYEPGIHYSQLQMQSGVTGINTLRIYNPIKQSYDQDPKGEFIKKWVHELENVPEAWIHEPWKMSDGTQKKSKCYIGIDYPYKIVDHSEAVKDAKSRFSKIIKKEGFNQKAKKIFSKLGSRSRKRDNLPNKQLSLF